MQRGSRFLSKQTNKRINSENLLRCDSQISGYSRRKGGKVNKLSNAIGLRGVGILFLTFFAGCTETHLPSKEPAEMVSIHNYALAFLTIGELAGELDDAAVVTAGQGHRTHIEQMGAEGTLLLAGPFGEPRADEKWRGIYVFDLADMEEAYNLARSDPSIQAGLFDVTIVPWRSDVDLRPLRDKLEDEKAAGAPFVPAPYVLAIGEATEEVQSVLHELRRKGKIICSGDLGGNRSNQFLILLKAETVGEAKEWLKTENTVASWEFSSLWATALLGDFAIDR
jgi:uncharacterized protein YciI